MSIVQEMGFEEARRAFHEDERWRSGPIYVFVDEVTKMRLDARAFIFPSDPSLEGQPWGPLIDAFGDYYEELYRVMSAVDEGWIYYAFPNPATGRDEPKASYVKSIDWDGNPAAIGAGIYRRDIPGTCESEEVHAMGLEADPSSERLQEFVRCAAMELESQGYFATRALSGDPRWSSGSIYVFGLDTYGNTLFSGDPASAGYGIIASELNNDLDGPFGGRDVVSVGDTFGETFLYYSRLNPADGMVQRKVTFVKRAVSYGLPILVGSGYYLGTEPQSLPAPNAQSVWSYLQSATYTDWPLFPGTGRFQPGRSPHGALLITYVSDTARNALTRRTGPFPTRTAAGRLDHRQGELHAGSHAGRRDGHVQERRLQPGARGLVLAEARGERKRGRRGHGRRMPELSQRRRARLRADRGPVAGCPDEAAIRMCNSSTRRGQALFTDGGEVCPRKQRRMRSRRASTWRRSIIKLIHEGPPPDWNERVIAATQPRRAKSSGHTLR